MYLCKRSNMWERSPATFTVTVLSFRSRSFFRQKMKCLNYWLSRTPAACTRATRDFFFLSCRVITLYYGRRLWKISSHWIMTLHRVCADVTCCRGSSMKLDPVRRRSIFMGFVSCFSSSKVWGNRDNVGLLNGFPGSNTYTFLIWTGRISGEVDSGVQTRKETWNKWWKK